MSHPVKTGVACDLNHTRQILILQENQWKRLETVNRFGKHPSRVTLRDIRCADLLLFVVDIGDWRALGCPNVRPLTIELSRIVNDGRGKCAEAYCK
jgi:hypothetical protein